MTKMIGRIWAVAAALTASLALASLLARRVIECLEGVAPAAVAYHPRTRPPRRVARGRLPDVMAGLKLRKDKVGTVWFEGTPWQVGQIGLLQSDVTRNGAFYKLPNRQVLEASGQAQSTPETNGRPALTR